MKPARKCRHVPYHLLKIYIEIRYYYHTREAMISPAAMMIADDGDASTDAIAVPAAPAAHSCADVSE